jgi:hypothetical protein
VTLQLLHRRQKTTANICGRVFTNALLDQQSEQFVLAPSAGNYMGAISQLVNTTIQKEEA